LEELKKDHAQNQVEKMSLKANLDSIVVIETTFHLASSHPL
jgi:hypothetical protein